MINYLRKADQLIPAVWWWWCRSGRGGWSTIAFSQVTAPHHVSVEEQEQRWRHDNYLHWQQGSRQDRSRRHGNTHRLCRDNLPKWMRKSVWPGQKSFNVKILNYLCVEVIWFLSRLIMFCLLSLMLTHAIVHTKVSTPDVFVTTDKREPGPRPPVTLSTWVQGHEHLQLAHSNTAWRGRLKKRDKITPTLWKLLTLCSPVVLQNLIFSVELVPLMSWYGHKGETGFDGIHLQIILVHWSIFTKNSYKYK